MTTCTRTARRAVQGHNGRKSAAAWKELEWEEVAAAFGLFAPTGWHSPNLPRDRCRPGAHIPYEPGTYTETDYLRYADHIESLQSHQCANCLYEARADIAAKLRIMAEDPTGNGNPAKMERLRIFDFTALSNHKYVI